MEAFIKRLIDEKISITTAESCTGGLVSSAITEVPGSSEIYHGSIIAYSNEIKASILGVGDETLETHGAVSEETAEEMAKGAGSIFKADISVAVSGIAGPGGGSDEKPVGTVCFAFLIRETMTTSTKVFKGSRSDIREQSVRYIFETLQSLLWS